MNFLAVGVSQAPCFEKQFDFQLIATMALRNDAQCNQLASIYGYAQKAGIADEWMKILKARIDRYQTGPFGRRRDLQWRGEEGFPICRHLRPSDLSYVRRLRLLEGANANLRVEAGPCLPRSRQRA